MLSAEPIPAPSNAACPELWDRAHALFREACAEPDGKTHFKKLMDAGQAFVGVVLAPGHFPIEKSFALNNVGLIMQALDRMDEAEKSFAFALQMNPTHATLLQNYATVRMVKGDLHGANQWFYKALDSDPKCAEARWNSALISLLFGDFRRGWLNYEWRWKCATFTWKPLITERPQWDGQDLTGKTILLTHEQGLGDTLMFCRYVPMVKARGAAKVQLVVPPELPCVLQGLEGLDEILLGVQSPHEFDYHCPLLSLPRIFKTRVKSVPATVPYLRVDGRAELRGDFKVGLVWAGRKEHANDKRRSMSLEQFAPLFEVPGISWYSFQYGERAAGVEKYLQITDLRPLMKDFADTARLLNAVDLLISVDTSVVHLAGALGRPCWTLLPFSPDWRWMLERTDSPWYPSMKLWRQEKKGEWGPVVERVKNELYAMATDFL